MSDIVNDEYPSKQVISNEELKAQLAAEHTTAAKIDFPTEKNPSSPLIFWANPGQNPMPLIWVAPYIGTHTPEWKEERNIEALWY